MKELPKVFANDFNKDLNNTQELFYGSERQTKNRNDINIIKKINNIFASPNHVYKSKVKITYKDRDEIHTIVGKTNINLVTIEGNMIKIVDIIDIERI